MQEIELFVGQWTDGPEQNRRAFIELKEYLAALTGVKLSFNPRPGLTYSLRASQDGQKDRPLFVMVDVIEDNPRWLSACFYGDMISDPDEKGDFVPGGLLGQDARCFDINRYDADFMGYIKAKIVEACTAARR
ncbi:MAG: hypothetical protein P4L42_17025 [Desulfocapsaceae bacterium]|nr:hypothetical protein [Desulfocapsaceae bacterium]